MTESRTENAAPRRRVLCLWLARFAAERILAAQARAAPASADPDPRPFAAWTATGNRRVIAAVNARAEALGLHPGQPLADARAILPGLAAAPAEPRADGLALARLAAWCRRFSPWTAPFGAVARGTVNTGDDDGLAGVAGIWLEVTGSAHLFGGEDAMARTITARLAGAGFSARAGLAATPGAAFALARAGTETPVLCPPGAERAALAPLPVAALRLDPATRATLHGLGLRRIGDLYPFLDGAARAGLARRFPARLLTRLDQALGRAFEPISPTRPRARHVTRLELPEPIRDSDAIARICARLTDRLAPMLAGDGLGARRVAFSAFRGDGRRARIVIGTARPVADAGTLARLLALRLDRLDPGPGADGFAMEALVVEPLRADQGRLGTGDGDDDMRDPGAALAPLIDRLGGRLGAGRVARIALSPNHLPERAQGFVRAGADDPPSPPGAIPPPRPLSRPLRLFPRPEPVEAVSEVPDGPPAWFRWRGLRHRVARAEGPERIALDWWTLPGWQAGAPAPGAPPDLGAAIRDYWRVEDTGGARFWLYRAGLHRPGAPARWYLHGVFP